MLCNSYAFYLVGLPVLQGNFSHLAGGASYFDRKPHDLRILLLDDDAWPKYYDGSFTKHGLGSLCVERIRMATWQQRITPGMRGGRAHAFGLTEASFTMTIPKENRKRTHFWYAVLADCYLEEYDAHPPEVRAHGLMSILLHPDPCCMWCGHVPDMPDMSWQSPLNIFVSWTKRCDNQAIVGIVGIYKKQKTTRISSVTCYPCAHVTDYGVRFHLNQL